MKEGWEYITLSSVCKVQNGFAYTFYRKFLKKKEIGENSFVYYVPYT